jgi:hypothetical protein
MSFYSGENVECGLLHCDAVHSTLKMEAVCSSKMLVPTYKTRQHHNPEDHNSQLHDQFQIVQYEIWVQI